MKLPKHPTLLRRIRDAKVKQLVARCPPLGASLGTRRGGGCQVTLKHHGTTRTVYVPKDLTEEVRASVQEHRRLKTLLREVTQLQLALIHGYKTQQARLRRQGLTLGTALAKTVAHFFPDFRGWLRELLDTRDQNRITYSRGFLAWETLLGLALKLGSRRQIRFELDTPAALANLNVLSGADQETLAHSDTLNHFLGHVPPGSTGGLRRKMIHRLVRMKALDSGRLLGRFLIGFDGTKQLCFRQRHCPHCLTQTHGETTLYFHYVLEAKLVTPEGLALSIGSEFIENADPNATKQDCELKAFTRLAQRLKKDFPQLPLCLLLDGLYANGTVMQLCQQNCWKYIITFQEGSLPALWQEYQTLRDLCPQNRHTHTTPEGVRQDFAWVHDLEHVDDRQRRHRTHAFQCRERVPGQEEEHFFAWLTNFRPDRHNVVDLANRGGRCRWKIENEGFNLQKNGGFNLEHAYSTADWPSKNFYLLLQIAHLLLQLLERSSLLTARPQALFGSLRNLAKRLGESLRNACIPAECLDHPAAALRIRLNTS